MERIKCSEIPRSTLVPEEPINVSIKPMLFAGDLFYPKGGWEDFKGYFDSEEDAKDYLLLNLGSFVYSMDDFWAHLVEDGKILRVWNQDEKRFEVNDGL